MLAQLSPILPTKHSYCSPFSAVLAILLFNPCPLNAVAKEMIIFLLIAPETFSEPFVQGVLPICRYSISHHVKLL